MPMPMPMQTPIRDDKKKNSNTSWKNRRGGRGERTRGTGLSRKEGGKGGGWLSTGMEGYNDPKGYIRRGGWKDGERRKSQHGTAQSSDDCA